MMEVQSDYHQEFRKHEFSPYSNDGGSIAGIAGEDFVVFASDTRLSENYSIKTRNQSKIFKLSNQTVLGSCGCWCDVLAFTRVIEARLKMYQHEHNKPMSISALAQLISTVMYYKRMFPYYTATALGGLDKDGKGVIYSYDCIGNISNTKTMANGSSNYFIQPFLDNQIGGHNTEREPVTLDRAIAVVKDAFISATEREIHTGDSVEIHAITKDGIKIENFPLRQD